MNSLEEIQEMLRQELVSSLDNIRSNNEPDYYNALLGDTSFLLAGILELELENNFENWDTEKWIDDSLLSKVRLVDGKILIWGTIIWGRKDITEQWTEPFYFELTFKQELTDFSQYTFLFADLDNSEVSYDDFNQNRGIWDKGYYKDNKWSPFERNWKYIINTKK